MARSLYTFGSAGGVNRLWRVTDTGVLTRLRGTIPAPMSGATEHGLALYCTSEGDDHLYRVTIVGDTFTVEDLGTIFTAESGGRPRALVSHNGDLLSFEIRGTVSRINPNNPSDTSGNFGRIADTSGVAVSYTHLTLPTKA